VWKFPLTSGARLAIARSHSLYLTPNSQCQGYCSQEAIEDCPGVGASCLVDRSRGRFRFPVLAEKIVMNCGPE
jgi:hypothetical protein